MPTPDNRLKQRIHEIATELFTEIQAANPQISYDKNCQLGEESTCSGLSTLNQLMSGIINWTSLPVCWSHSAPNQMHSTLERLVKGTKLQISLRTLILKTERLASDHLTALNLPVDAPSLIVGTPSRAHHVNPDVLQLSHQYLHHLTCLLLERVGQLTGAGVDMHINREKKKKSS